MCLRAEFFECCEPNGLLEVEEELYVNRALLTLFKLSVNVAGTSLGEPQAEIVLYHGSVRVV